MLPFIDEETEAHRSIIMCLGWPNQSVAELDLILEVAVFRTHVIAPLLAKEIGSEISKILLKLG